MTLDSLFWMYIIHIRVCVRTAPFFVLLYLFCNCCAVLGKVFFFFSFLLPPLLPLSYPCGRCRYRCQFRCGCQCRNDSPLPPTGTVIIAVESTDTVSVTDTVAVVVTVCRYRCRFLCYCRCYLPSRSALPLPLPLPVSLPLRLPLSSLFRLPIPLTLPLPLPLSLLRLPLQIKKAFCPPEVVDANPILDYCKHILFAWSGEVICVCMCVRFIFVCSLRRSFCRHTVDPPSPPFPRTNKRLHANTIFLSRFSENIPLAPCHHIHVL